MWIRDFWDRVLAKFKKEESVSEPVMELKAEEAPEPVPERKTSDEMIVEMAQSAAKPSEPENREIGEVPEAETEPEAEMEPKEAADPEEEAYEDDKDYFEAEE